MTIAAAIQAQMLQSLLQAMQATDAGLKAGASLRAVFAGWATPDGQAPAEGERAQAQALIAGKPVTLTLAADAARVAALRPGAVMTIAVDEGPAGPKPAQARLVAVAPPEGEGLGRAASAAPGDLALKAAKPAAPVDPALAAGLAARAVAGPIVGAALARQDGLGPLLANLAALDQAADEPALARQLAALPPGLAQAARQVLRQGLPLEAATPDALKQAVSRSGVFNEANLARGAPELAAGDLKSALVALKTLLTGAAAEETAGPPASGRAPAAERAASPEAKSAPAAPAPPQPRAEAPRRDGPPLAQPEAAASVDLAADAPSSIIAKLTEQSAAALDRLSLAQYASLPAPQDGTASRTAGSSSCRSRPGRARPCCRWRSRRTGEGAAPARPRPGSGGCASRSTWSRWASSTRWSRCRPSRERRGLGRARGDLAAGARLRAGPRGGAQGGRVRRGRHRRPLRASVHPPATPGRYLDRAS